MRGPSPKALLEHRRVPDAWAARPGLEFGPPDHSARKRRGRGRGRGRPSGALTRSGAASAMAAGVPPSAASLRQLSGPAGARAAAEAEAERSRPASEPLPRGRELRPSHVPRRPFKQELSSRPGPRPRTAPPAARRTARSRPGALRPRGPGSHPGLRARRGRWPPAPPGPRELAPSGRRVSSAGWPDCRPRTGESSPAPIEDPPRLSHALGAPPRPTAAGEERSPRRQPRGLVVTILMPLLHPKVIGDFRVGKFYFK